MKTRRKNFDPSHITMSDRQTQEREQELAKIRRFKERSKQIEREESSEEDGSDVGSTNEQEDEATTKDGVEEVSARNLKASTNAVQAMLKTAKSLEKSLKRKRSEDIPDRPMKKPREDEKEDGRDANPNPLAFVIGESPNIDRDTEGLWRTTGCNNLGIRNRTKCLNPELAGAIHTERSRSFWEEVLQPGKFLMDLLESNMKLQVVSQQWRKSLTWYYLHPW
ncbi:uncharacterized protein LOC131880997 [Tigriopus californicus]|uniref:uncharacterized protein LOC131880997 n=1 Tax=Tigriopus californicus TaxID=6832 RepID=UPI0027D9F647|nr:uncharacterized protein LOC131880997 [Tigriopus californicus]